MDAASQFISVLAHQSVFSGSCNATQIGLSGFQTQRKPRDGLHAFLSTAHPGGSGLCSQSQVQAGVRWGARELASAQRLPEFNSAHWPGFSASRTGCAPSHAAVGVGLRLLSCLHIAII